MDIALLLHKAYPEAVWSITDNNYDTLSWSGDIPKPTYTELQDLWNQKIEAELYNEKMAELRRRAYVQESDPLFFDYQKGEVKKSEWLDKVAEIKTRYPYSAFSQQ